MFRGIHNGIGKETFGVRGRALSRNRMGSRRFLQVDRQHVQGNSMIDRLTAAGHQSSKLLRMILHQGVLLNGGIIGDRNGGAHAHT